MAPKKAAMAPKQAAMKKATKSKAKAKQTVLGKPFQQVKGKKTVIGKLCHKNLVLANTSASPLTLKEKMAKIQDAQDMEAAPLTPQDWQKLSTQWNQTYLNKAPPEVKEMWHDISSKGQRQGKRKAQREILEAFIMDPKMGEQFMSATKSLTSTQSMEEKGTWVTHRKLMEEMSESEAEDQIASGAVLVRKNPKCPTRKQYLITSTYHKKKLEKSVKVNMASCQKLSEEEASTMNTMFNSYRMEESHMNRVKDSKSMLLGGLSSDDEEAKTVERMPRRSTNQGLCRSSTRRGVVMTRRMRWAPLLGH